MQDVVISGNVLEEMKVSPSEFLIDLAVYLYDKERLTIEEMFILNMI